MPVIRIEFQKEGSTKYISHLDLMRTIQRSVRRADIPVEYTKGFNPHSRISYGPALAVGVSSSGEYLDMEIKEQLDQDRLIERLNTSLPSGIRATAARYVPDGSSSLASVINAACYSIDGRAQPQNGHLKERLSEFFSLPHVFIEKTDKKGRKKQVDIIPMILDIEKILVQDGRVVLEVILETGSKGNLKPADLLGAIIKETGINLRDVTIHRKGLLVKRGERYFSPLEIFD